MIVFSSFKYILYKLIPSAYPTTCKKLHPLSQELSCDKTQRRDVLPERGVWRRGHMLRPLPRTCTRTNWHTHSSGAAEWSGNWGKEINKYENTGQDMSKDFILLKLTSGRTWKGHQSWCCGRKHSSFHRVDPEFNSYTWKIIHKT